MASRDNNENLWALSEYEIHHSEYYYSTSSKENAKTKYTKLLEIQVKGQFYLLKQCPTKKKSKRNSAAKSESFLLEINVKLNYWREKSLNFFLACLLSF